MFRFRNLLILLILITTFSSFTLGQETETKVVDEVIAQVNDGVLTLSRVTREKKAIIDSMVQEGKPRADAERDLEGKQGEMIANLINEELLMQRAKEIGVDSDIETSINARFLEIMKQNKVSTLDELYKIMQGQGVDPEELRDIWRKQATRDRVIQRDLQSKLYWTPTEKEVHEYYEKNKARFTKPETVTLSELFLSFAGRDEASVRQKAAQLATSLKAGGDFEKAVVENSDRQDAAKTKGKTDPVPVSELDPKFANAIKDLKTGGVSAPIEVDNVGIEILRVDERSAASNESSFDEQAVRMAILQEKLPTAQKEYFAKLRDDAYIKVSDAYRPLVSPILFADERKATTSDNGEVKRTDGDKKKAVDGKKDGDKKIKAPAKPNK